MCAGIPRVTWSFIVDYGSVIVAKMNMFMYHILPVVSAVEISDFMILLFESCDINMQRNSRQ
jgi:hypothetical protein